MTELDQGQQPGLELEQASGQLVVKHRRFQVRKHMKAGEYALTLQPSLLLNTGWENKTFVLYVNTHIESYVLRGTMES